MNRVWVVEWKTDTGHWEPYQVWMSRTDAEQATRRTDGAPLRRRIRVYYPRARRTP